MGSQELDYYYIKTSNMIKSDECFGFVVEIGEGFLEKQEPTSEKHKK